MMRFWMEHLFGEHSAVPAAGNETESVYFGVRFHLHMRNLLKELDSIDWPDACEWPKCK